MSLDSLHRLQQVVLPGQPLKNSLLAKGESFQAALIAARQSMFAAFSGSADDKPAAEADLSPFAGQQWLLDFMAREVEKRGALPPSVPPRHLQRIYAEPPSAAKMEAVPLAEAEIAAPAETPAVEAADKSPRSLAVAAARKFGVPENLFVKLIGQESSFNPLAKSPKGAMGLGQLMPGTARDMGLRVDDDDAPGSVWNVESNLRASAQYLRRLYGRFADSGASAAEAWKLAQAAYNAGPGNVDKAIQRVDDAGKNLTWEKVAAELPAVTGRASSETLRYVEKLNS